MKILPAIPVADSSPCFRPSSLVASWNECPVPRQEVTSQVNVSSLSIPLSLVPFEKIVTNSDCFGEGGVLIRGLFWPVVCLVHVAHDWRKVGRFLHVFSPWWRSTVSLQISNRTCWDVGLVVFFFISRNVTFLTFWANKSKLDDVSSKERTRHWISSLL